MGKVKAVFRPFGIAQNAWAMLIGFLVGTIVNKYVEHRMPNFPGYGVEVISVLKGDDLVLMGIGLAIMLLSRFVAKIRLAFYFGLGFLVAIIADELMELALGEGA